MHYLNYNAKPIARSKAADKLPLLIAKAEPALLAVSVAELPDAVPVAEEPPEVTEAPEPPVATALEPEAVLATAIDVSMPVLVAAVLVVDELGA